MYGVADLILHFILIFFMDKLILNFCVTIISVHTFKRLN